MAQDRTHANQARRQRRINRVLSLRSRGFTLQAIGEKLGVTHAAIWSMLRALEVPKFKKICALLECSKPFETHISDQRYCCHKHAKRDGERKRLGRDTRWMPCRLPECDEQLLCPGVGQTNAKRYCTRTHGARHDQRVDTGYYEKLVERTACAVCGWWGPGLQQHHIHYRSRGGSNEKKNLVWLCPNHHGLIHAGLARFDGRVYEDLREEMRTRELKRRRVWGE